MALNLGICPVTGEAICFCGLDENDPAREPVTKIFEADDQDGALQGQTFEYSAADLTSTAGNDGYLLSDGNTDDVTFVGGDDVIKDFQIGEDALTIDVPGLELADQDVSTSADFVAMIEAATLVELNGPAVASVLEAYICEHPEGAADLVLVVRDADGQAAHSVKLIGLATEIGVEALEDAGAIVEPHDAEASEHDHGEAPMAATALAEPTATAHDHSTPDVIEDNNAFLMAMGEGSRIEIHAADASKDSWTQLSQTARAGDSILRLTEDTGWEVGDKIAIAPSGQDYTEDEERTILRISDDGKTVTLDRPLEFDHYGRVETYSNGQDRWQVDMRAEVALLSRNVTIQGDEDSAIDGYGAHTMVMHGASQHISGAEFTRVGQEDILGKYPIHWHMSGDASGQYVTNVSVHQSYQKGSTIHGTSNVLYEDNVIYDHVGHGVFMEDGFETGNVIKGNLVFGTHASKTGEPIPTDRADVSSYWIENVSNTFIDNHAAGSANVGFFIAPATETGPHGLSEGLDVRNNADDFYFVGNTASSSEFGVFLDGHIDGETLEHVDGQNFSLEGSLWFVDTTAYANSEVGLWSFKGNGSDNYVVVQDAKLADNGSNLEVRGDDFLFLDSVSIGETGNIAADKNVANIGVKTYRNSDAAMVDVHFANFDNHRDDIAISLQEGELKDYGDNFQGITFDDVDNELVFRDVTALLRPDDAFNTVARDDGSLTGVAGGAWITRNLPGEPERAGYNSYVDRNLDNAFVTTEGAMGVTELYLFGKRADQHKEITVTRSVDNLKFDQDVWLTHEGRGGEDLYQFITPTADDQEAAFLVELGGPSNVFPSSFNLSLDGIRVGEAVVYEIPNIASVSPGFAVDTVGSMRELFAADSTAAFVQNGSLFIRVVGVRASNETYLGANPDDQIFGAFMGTESPGGYAISFDITPLSANDRAFQDYGQARFDRDLLDALERTDGYVSSEPANAELILPEAPVAHAIHASTSDTVRVTDDMARWSDADAWGGAVPAAQNIVVVGPGQTIVIDQSATVKGIIVDGGNLIVEDARGGPQNAIKLVSDYVLVINGGLFQAGTEANPLDRDFTLELTGDDPDFDLHVTDILNGSVADTVFATAVEHVPVPPADNPVEPPLDPLPGSELRGTPGDDTLSGRDGDDVLYGNGGDDLLRGGDGDDTAFGGAGEDNLQGGNGDDTLNGGQGDDYLAGSYDDDVVSGGSGDDEVYGDYGVDILHGDAGNDKVGGGHGDDTLYGGAGDDNLIGGIGEHSGDDVLVGGAGADSLNGGLGADTYVFEAVQDSTANSRDTIQQFSATDDKLDVSALEITGLDELTVTRAGNQTIVTHDGSAFEVLIQGQHTLQASNFVFAEAEETEEVGTIHGRFYTDMDGDGSYDAAADTGLVGHRVELHQGGVAVANTTTNSNGFYSFQNVAEGNGYTVRFFHEDAPTDFVVVDGGNIGPQGNFNTASFALDANQTVRQNALLEAPVVTGTVHGRFFTDIDGDGAFNAETDTGAAGHLVELRQDGIVVASTTTNANGFYRFEDVAPGEGYTVRFHHEDAATDFVTTEGLIGSAGNYNTTPFTVEDNQTVLQNALLEAPVVAGTVHGRFYTDIDGDGSYDAGADVGVAGHRVELHQDGVAVASTTTNPNGFYRFEDVAPGDGYTVRFHHEDAATDFVTTEGLIGSAGNYNTTPFTVDDNQTVLQSALLEAPMVAGTVQGRFYTDMDGDGAFDAQTDIGVAGHLVELHQDGVLVASATTNANGFYSFQDVAPGEGYSVRFFHEDAATDFVVTDGGIGPLGNFNTSPFAVNADQTVRQNAVLEAPVPDTGALLELGSETDLIVDARDKEFHVTFTEKITDAVVVMGPVSIGDGDPAFARVTEVTETGFSFIIDEWQYQDGRIDTGVSVSWMALTAGEHELPDGSKIQAGSVQAANEDWVEVGFAPGFDQAPMVFTQTSSFNGPHAVVTRNDGVGTDGFAVKMQEEEALPDAHFAERIDWIAIEPSQNSEWQTGTQTVRSNAVSTGVEVEPFDTGFVFLADMQSENGPNTASLRYEVAEDGGLAVRVQEETSLDDEMQHRFEGVAFLAAAEGIHVLSELDYAGA